MHHACAYIDKACTSAYFQCTQNVHGALCTPSSELAWKEEKWPRLSDSVQESVGV